MTPDPRILVVDDTPANVRLLEAVLGPRGYEMLTAGSGPEALEAVTRDRPDLVLLDILMPGMDGYEVCRRLRADPVNSVLPVIMITASGNEEKLRALEAGADDFIAKPFDQAELLARVRSLLRVKAYHDLIEGQAAELAEWKRTLEARVDEQVAQLERLGRLRRYLSPQIAELVLSAPDETVLKSHRREVAVLFCDLRGFTAFSEEVEPEEVMTALSEFHEAVGPLINSFAATVGFFAGDGLMVFFNDPLPCPDPAEQAVRLAVAMRSRMATVTERWKGLAHNLGFGVGIAVGYATLGEVGFAGRYDYAVIGNVCNLAARLCDSAVSGQIVISPRVRTVVEHLVEVEPVGDLHLKGFHKPVTATNVVSLISPSSGRSGAQAPVQDAEPKDTGVGHDVFISYASEDNATADAVCTVLEKNQVRCWIAPRDVLPGERYADAIMRGIRRSKLMVVVFSSSANASTHVTREIERAASEDVPILPFRIEHAQPASHLEYFISDTQWLDALTEPVQQHLDRLATTVNALLEKIGKPDRAASGQPSADKDRQEGGDTRGE